MATNYGNNGKVEYDKNTDYTALRDQAAASGDYKAAAQYEAQRNQKIQDLNASGENKWNAQVENKYSRYLDSGSNVNDGSRPSYAEDYKNNGAADKYGVDHQYAENLVSDKVMSAADLNKLQQYGDDYNAAAAAREQVQARTDLSEAEKNQLIAQYQSQMDKAHENAEAVRALYGYSGGVDGSEFLQNRIPASGGGNGGGGYTIPTVPLLTNRAPDLTDLLDQWLDAAKKEQELKVDYAVQQGVDELNRAKEDAEVQFQTQQNQVDENEAKALDNQALYAEARGDRGGIGQAQYAQIQATAMTNRRTINSARTKLATDTARQIADLRAQGEFQKADALLELSQTYLSQLMDLEKWGAEFNLDVDKFNSQIRMWQAEFELAVSEVMGEYQGVPTLDKEKFEASKDQWDKEFTFTTQSAQKENLASSGLAALSVGIRPSAAQQAAMGYTDAQVDAELAAYKLAQAAGVKGSGGGGNPPKAPEPTISEMLKTFETENEAMAYLLDQKVSEARYQEYMNLFYQYQEEKEKEKQPSAEMQEQERLQGLYGTSFTQALAWANTMLSKGVSDADIEAKLKQFSSSSLNEEGLRTIMQFIAEKRVGLGV